MNSSFSLFNSSITGMGAQSSALGNIFETIANANMIGYKDGTINSLTALNRLRNGDAAMGGASPFSSGRMAMQSLIFTPTAGDLLRESPARMTLPCGT